MNNLNKIEQAKELIMEAMQLVDEVAQENNKFSHYSAYGKYGFQQLLGEGNPLDSSIEDLLNDKDYEIN
mgnify:CR=1 FL=1|tara:strand:+ start:85 stop:291 length:207 start_codon:yes stop_codon:yes gene_type:complete